MIVGVLAEHPDYSTRLHDDAWLATCDGPACAWYSGELPPADSPRGAGAAERAHREHVALALLEAGVGVQERPQPVTVQMMGGPVVHAAGVARCPLCGLYLNAVSHAGGCPSEAGAIVRARLQKLGRAL